MKISVEIKGEEFLYDFEVGKEKGHGSRPLNVHGLALLSAIIEECHKSWARETADQIKEIECFAYLEKHPEVIEKYKKSRR